MASAPAQVPSSVSSFTLPSWLPRLPDLPIASAFKVFATSISLIKNNADVTVETLSFLASGMELTGLNSLRVAILSLRSAASLSNVSQILGSISYFAKNRFSDAIKLNPTKETGFALANLNETISWANKVKIIDVENSSGKIFPALGVAGSIGATIGLTAISVQTFVKLRNQISDFCFNDPVVFGIDKSRLKAKTLKILPNLLSIASTTTDVAITALRYVPTEYTPKNHTFTLLSMFAKVTGIGSYLLRSDNLAKLKSSITK
jgi:hypothetical protein